MPLACRVVTANPGCTVKRPWTRTARYALLGGNNVPTAPRPEFPTVKKFLKSLLQFGPATCFRVLNPQSTTMNPETLEHFVDADEAARFLSLTRRRVLDLARAKKLPAHPIGDGARRVWRFRLTELAAAVVSTQKIGLASRERAGMVRPQTISGASE